MADLPINERTVRELPAVEFVEWAEEGETMAQVFGSKPVFARTVPAGKSIKIRMFISALEVVDGPPPS